MTAAWLLARAEWRARWVSVAMIALLAALAGTVTIAAVAAARRADSAFERLAVTTHAPNLYIPVEQPPDAAELRRIADLPGVEGAWQFALLVAAPDAAGFRVGQTTIAGVYTAAAGSTRWPGTIVVRGRLPDSTRDDEFIVNEVMWRRLGARLGQRIRLVSLDPAQGAAALAGNRNPGRPAGPAITATLVGVYRGVEDVSDTPEPLFFVTPEFYRRHAAGIARLDQVLVRADESALPAVGAYARARLKADAQLRESSQLYRTRVDTAVGVQTAGLIAVGIVGLLAGLLAVGQAMARQAAGTAHRDASLRALGMTRRHRVGVGVLLAVPGGVTAAAVAVVGGWLLAPLLVTGVARTAEPDPGRWADPLVFGLGGAGVVCCVLGLAAAAWAWELIDIPGRAARDPGRPSRVDDGLIAAVVGPARAIGMRMALDANRGRGRQAARERGRASVPTRSALASAVLCIAGIVAVIAFTSTIAHLMTTPRLSGASFDAAISPGDSVLAPGRFATWADTTAAQLRADHGAVATAVVRSGQVRLSRIGTPSPSIAVQGEAVEQRDGAIPAVVRAGQPPRTAGEIAVGQEILDSLDLSVGDQVRVRGTAGSRDLRLVGVYVSASDNDVDRGALVSGAAFDRLVTQAEATHVRMRFADGTDVDAGIDRIGRQLIGVYPWRVPSSVDNLDELGGLPWVVVTFLALVALVVAVHALFSAIRVWRRDLGILRALGFVPAQVRAAVRWQALTTAALGLAFGLPLGLAIARLAWSEVATALGVVDERVIPWPALAVVIVLLPAVAILLALPPGRVAARARVAEALRAE